MTTPPRTPTTAAGRAFVALYEPKDRGVQAEWVATIEAEARAAPDPAPLGFDKDGGTYQFGPKGAALMKAIDNATGDDYAGMLMDALEEVRATPAPLDVERLARAVSLVMSDLDWTPAPIGVVQNSYWQDRAVAIAREYAKDPQP